MNEDTKRREVWAMGLQFFLSSRLRTPPFDVAVRTHPGITFPSMVPNTQHLLDGIVWSLNDHPDWAQDAWLYVQNHIRDAAERLEETVAQFTTDLAVRQRQGAGKGATAPAVDASETGCRFEREHMYSAHAAVQDLYLAFCVLDAVLKGCCGPSSAGARARLAPASNRLRESVEKELPHLVSDYFPVFAIYPAENPYIADAVEEYRLLFLAILESWVVLYSVDAHTIRRLEEHIRHKLKVSREALAQAGGDAGSGSGGSGASGRSGVSAAAMQQSLDVLIRGTLRTPSLSGASPRGGKLSKRQRTAETAERHIRNFLSSIYPSRRLAGMRFRCPHCGAPFKDEKARDTHYRYHFHSNNVLSDEKVVRLSYPSQEDFIMYVGDIGDKGYYPKTTELLEEAYKNGEKGILKVRRMDELAQKQSEPKPS